MQAPRLLETQCCYAGQEPAVPGLPVEQCVCKTIAVMCNRAAEGTAASGYTLQEACVMARSTVAGQRVAAMQLLAAVLGQVQASAPYTQKQKEAMSTTHTGRFSSRCYVKPISDYQTPARMHIILLMSHRRHPWGH